MTLDGCPVCGASHRACGQPSTSAPIDLNIHEKVAGMALKNYEVEVNGTVTTMKLDDDAAKRLGVYQEPKQADTKKAAAPANKSRTASNKKA